MSRLCLIVVLFACAANAQPDGGISGDPFIDPSFTVDPKALESQSAIIWTKGDDRQHSVTGGCWLNERVCIDSARRQAQLYAEVQELKKQNETISPQQFAVIGAFMAIAFAVGFGVAKLGK